MTIIIFIKNFFMINLLTKNLFLKILFQIKLIKMAEDYLNKNAKNIIQPMVTAVFKELPKDPVI